MLFARTENCHFVTHRVVPSFSPLISKPNRRRSRGAWGTWLACWIAGWLLCSAVVWAIPTTLRFNGVVSTLGTGTLGTSPSGLVVDLSGNVYVADTTNNGIVKVTPSGTAAALSVSGLTLSAPSGLTVDSSGNLYIADAGNSRVVEVTPAGSFSVISTTGYTLSSPLGVAVDTSGNIFISDTGNNRVLKVDSGGTASLVSPAGFTFSSPRGVAVDTYGNLYVADYGNSRVVRVTTGGTGSTVTSTPALSLSGPSGVFVGRNGNIYIVDQTNNKVAIVDPAGVKTSLLNDTPSFTQPTSIAVSPAGIIYVVDSGGASSSGRVQTFQTPSVGFGRIQLGSSASMNLPFTVGAASTLTSVAIYTGGVQNLDFVIASGSTCVASTTNTDCVVQVTFSPTAAGLRAGALVVVADSGSLTVPLYGTADAPMAAMSPGVASVVSNSGTPISISGAFNTALDGAGNIYVTSYTGSTITKIPAGGGSGSAISTGAYTLSSPTGLAVDAMGNLFIADYGHNRILEVTPDGTTSVLSINGVAATTVGGVTAVLHQPVALNFDGSGNLYITDYGSGRIIEVSPSSSGDGTVANGNGYVLATGSYSFGQVNITGSVVDPSGNLYIADRNASPPVILKVDPLGTVTPVSLGGVSTLSSPYGVTTDSSGNLYIMDSGHQRIVQVTSTGAASVMSFSGATLNINIFGITADPNGNMVVADFASNRLVRVDVGRSALAFPTTTVGSSSSAKTTTITDLGSQPLVFSADPTYTGNFAQDASASNLCTASTTLAVGASCNVSMVFTPHTAGSLSANVTVTHNMLNVADSTQQIAVSGTGLSSADTTAVVVAANPTTVSIGQPLTITATVSDTTAGHSSTVPTGNVTFIDTVGSTAVSLNGGTAVALSGGAATLTGVTLSGAGTHTITATYAGVLGSFQASSNSTTVEVSAGLDTPSVVVTSSANPAMASSAVTFTATVSGSGETPTGTVTFRDGSTQLGSGTLASGAATYTTSSLAGGVHSITAVYSGDSSYATRTSSALSQVVHDFTWSLPSGGSASATVTAGGTASYGLVVAPSSGTTLPAEVTLAVTGLPTGAVATFNPPSLAAGAGTSDVTLSVRVPAQTAVVQFGGSSNLLAIAVSPMMLGWLLLPGRGKMRQAAGKRGRAAGLLLLLVTCAMLTALTGCGGGSRTVAPARTYALTVTATCGSVSHSTNLSLTVQ